jgi:hypothetical protein
MVLQVDCIEEREQTLIESVGPLHFVEVTP